MRAETRRLSQQYANASKPPAPSVDSGKFGSIHFKFGLHDLKAVTKPVGLKTTNDPDDPRRTVQSLDARQNALAPGETSE
jgi:hypothetical protein